MRLGNLNIPLSVRQRFSVLYTRTAFLDETTGNDVSAELNNPSLPFQYFPSAVYALAAAYPGQTTTIRLMADSSDGFVDDVNELDTLLTTGLTIMSHDATVRTLDGVTSFGTQAGAMLTLSKVTLASLTKEAHVGTAVQSAGTITGDAQTTITALGVNADSSPGAAGTPGTGNADSANNGASGADGDPPENGQMGANADSSGTNGVAGNSGHRAWNVTLLGSGVCTTLSAVSSSTGGDGGAGGAGGAAVGGNGGKGGDSTASIQQDGGNGGNGGNATSNGGNGGNAGNGGAGGNVYKAAGWTVTTFNAGGFSAGNAGVGGASGSVTAGTGGLGGAGAMGGNVGTDGTGGSTQAVSGSDGASGASGVSGSIINL